MLKFWVWIGLVVGGAVLGAVPKGGRTATYLLPMTCQELLPDMSPYLGFFEAVAMGSITVDKNFAKRLLRILALRNKLAERGDKDQNSVDLLLRKTLCFYREQKEPLKPVAYDDPSLLQFLRASLKELELKVEDAIYQFELERAQRKQYELLLQKNRDVVERVREEAEDNASRSYQRLSSSAEQKVKVQ